MSGTFPTPQPVLADEPEWQAFQPAADVPQIDTEDEYRDPTAPVEPDKPSVTEVLGTNRKRASGVRQLTKKDLDQLRGYYAAAGVLAMPFNQRAAEALTESADRCVDAWDELAKQNDRVRKALLAILEGGAWGLVLSAHVPIIWAFIPDKALERLPLMFGKNGETEDE